MNFCPKTFRENISAYFYNPLIFPDVSAVKVETYLCYWLIYSVILRKQDFRDSNHR